MRLSELIRIWGNEIEDKSQEELKALRIELLEKRENRHNFYTNQDIELFKSQL